MRFIGICFLLLGTLPLLASLGLYLSERAFLQRATFTSGTVVQLVERRSSKGSPSWAPRITFRDSNGANRVFTAELASRPPSHNVGDQVRVVYEPADPDKADIDSPFYDWMRCWITAGMGTVFFLIGFSLARNRS